ncbi:MAG: hypothetical protein P8M22_01600 [Phycisphaerales bacterium]|nr:hypothetical protein [Phycisphaerales bacterium]
MTSAAARSERRFPGSVRVHARSFTLIEILIVLSLLIAAAALVMPMFTSTLAERRFENTMDRVTGHLLSARLESMERRAPIEVVWTGEEMQARIFDPELLDSVPSGFLDGDTSADIELDLPESQEDQPEAIEVLVLPPGVTCLDSEPVFEDQDALFQSSEDDVQTIRIAVYLPDGSVIERGPHWIVDGDGRTAALWIDRRTGLPTLNRRGVAPRGEEETEEDTFKGPEMEPDPGLSGSEPAEGDPGS